MSTRTLTEACPPVLALIAGVIVIALCAAPATAQTPVLSHDFENGTAQGWIPRGPVTLTNTDEVGSRTGLPGRSLRTTGRTAGFHGPSLDTLGLLTKGATYQVSVWVRLVAGQPATQVRVTMQRTLPTGNSFDTIAQSAATGVTDAGWTQLTGLYAFAGTDPTGLLLYVEATNATSAYYIDDFRIDKIADPAGLPPDTTGLSSTFESGSAEGWTSRTGTEVVAVSTADAHTGTTSLLTTNRTAAFRGPNFNVTNVMFNGSRYRVSLWAKLAPGEAGPQQLRVSLQRNAGTVTTFHTVIGNTNVTADAWVRLVATYDVALANSSLFLYVESASSLASFHIDDVQVTYVPPPTIEPDLPSVAQSLAGFFPIGAAVRSATIAGVHGDLLKKHFNSVTSENDMKWDATEPQPGNFTFANADQQVAFAQANGMLVRGHTLAWHSQTPAWVFTDPLTGTTMLPTPANHDLLLQRLDSHVRNVVTHFGNKVHAWDVVNEVIDEGQPDCMRKSTWFDVTGKDFIDTAFRVAREVAPDAVLFINDYNSTIPNKRACLFALVADLKARGIPVDGVGHQMHDNLEFPPVSQMAETLDLFATLGVTQHVTEMDVSIYTGSNNTSIANYDEIPAERFLRLARHYRDYFEVFRDHKDQLTSVTLWGLADDSTWLTSSGRVNAPLLFDDQLHHKLAYDGVVNPETLPKDPASVALSNLAQTYDGGPHAVTVTTTPPGLPVDVLYDGSAAPPVNAGTYHVDAAVDHPDWAGSTSGTLVVERAPAAVVLGGLGAAYTGTPHPVTVTTVPAGLAVTVTYDGSSVPPTDPGSYAVVATVADANHFGSASGTLTIAVTTLVRHAPVVNGRVEGSLQVLLPESATVNGGAVITGDLLVPGTPTVRLNGAPTYGGTRDGAGSASPSGYAITLNGGARLRQVVRRTDPAALPAVPLPPRPAGTRDVVLNGPGGSVGSFATLRNLTLNGGAGTVSVPSGTYGTFTVNGSGTLVLGEAGATTPAVYNLQGLVLNGGSRLTVVGPVVINLAAGVTANASMGTTGHPEWLDLNLAAGGLTLNGGASLNGYVTAPSGAVMLNGALTGGVAADRLTVNGGGLLRVVD
jgi:endo-1,4-beta-xylanase